jgi:hypothetical protein
MRRALVVPLLVATVLAAPGVRATEEKAPAAPRIRVEPDGFDFGKALPGKTLRKEFALRNFGDAELVIEGVTTTCGCTAALTADSRVKPGGTTLLRVTLETRSYSGKLERQVLVRSNDPQTPLLPVKVSATVETPAARPAAKPRE